jgi:geranylgeranyl pyrophosphate synthase
MNLTFPDFLADSQARIQHDMERHFPDARALSCGQLQSAMRYSVLNGGKRVRAALVYAAHRAVNSNSVLASTNTSAVDTVACAVEFIHAYSLIHDDLPAMDDDALRRGKPTCHIAFDEATAILAGDALQTLAFECLAAAHLPADLRCQLILTLARAAGHAGMVGGQAMDLAAENRAISLAELEILHRHKTGALITASVRMGAMAAGASEQQLTALDTYSAAIGLAFQVQDDILDIESSTEELGKTQGADIAHHKSTYPGLMGLCEAKKLAAQLEQDALNALECFGEHADMLAGLARYIVQRKY